MKIQKMFLKDINRPINGVIKVGQDDADSLAQELGEYIITKELRRHFTAFLDNYSVAIGRPTDNIGVWISGFFGSGKSHFLKILSYLLSNTEVGGTKAIDFFKEKLDDPITYATAVRCVGIPTESILFNIDIEGPINKDKTAVLRVFAKVFYNHMGYYGDDLKIAKLERFIEKQGKAEEFRASFEQKNSAPWAAARDSCAFFEDDIVSVLQSVLGMSETNARNWFNGVETAELSIKTLVSEIKEYVDSKGRDFRLLFCIDEVGQYIGDDGDLMINLQSIVEEVGSQCKGKVWIMVTSQEAIDSVVKITGDDFSKIQGRFYTRLSLSSSSVDEVIERRVLAKNEDADSLLRLVYDKEQAALKNLFTFKDNPVDIKGFSDGGKFSATYPFVPYQFIVIQKVLAEIRKHGNSGKHLSGGERSMLSGFQEAAQKVQDRDENTLVPFHRFYDTVHTFLESAIRRVINRCQTAADNHDGVEPADVSVLKLLYLVRYIDDIKANIDNIAILMIEDTRTDKINLRAEVTASLERLHAQNYIARNGDNYMFLTDEEQDIAIDIRNTPVDSASIVQSISHTVWGELYASKKFKYGKYDFAYDQYIDDAIAGSANGGMRLRVVTVASDYFNAQEAKLIMDSHANNEAIILLSNEAPYFEELEEAAKIRKYVKQKNVSQQPESIQRIIRDRQESARKLEESAAKSIDKAIQNAVVYVHGEKTEIKGGSAKEKLDTALAHLVESVYYKLNLLNVYCENDADVLRMLNDPQTSLPGMGENNEAALNEISQWLELQTNSHVPVSMGDVQKRYQAIPYGWREVDIAALVARLIAGQKISVKYGGAFVGKDDKRIVDCLRKKSEVDKTSVTRRIAPSEELRRKSAAFLREYLGVMDIPADEDGLTDFVINIFEEKSSRCAELLENEYGRERYPRKEVVTAARDLMNDILSQRKDSVALLSRLAQKQDELLDSKEDMEEIETFFKSQKDVFDKAAGFIRNTHVKLFESNGEFMSLYNSIREIITAEKPYTRIRELPELTQAITVLRERIIEEIAHSRTSRTESPVTTPKYEPPKPLRKVYSNRDVDEYVEWLRKDLYAKLERGEEITL